MRLFAIGDVHGCYAMMMALLGEIEKHKQSDDTIVFLGDYTDRGPDTKSVHKELIGMADQDDVVILIGNHDMMLYNEVIGVEYGWATFYGHPVIESYDQDYDEISRDSRLLVASSKAYHTEGDYLFCHSGGNPNRALLNNSLQDWTWHRPSGVNDDYGVDDFYVVHGHTPVDIVNPLTRRCNLDTGACFGGKLSCGVFNTEAETPGLEYLIQVDGGLKIEIF